MTKETNSNPILKLFEEAEDGEDIRKKLAQAIKDGFFERQKANLVKIEHLLEKLSTNKANK